jgi:YbbR domain-containing protein
MLNTFYDEIKPADKSKVWHEFFMKNYKEKVIALILTFALWFVLVYGSVLEVESFSVPIQTAPLELKNYKVSVEPKEVKVTFLGPRRSFFLTSENQISLLLNIPNATTGRRTVNISDSNLNFPKGLTVEKIEPSKIKLNIEEKTP